MSVQAPRRRDAARSRSAILDAAERLFAERGPRGVSLGEVGAAAGVSRATPSYFFGSKEGLHRAVLERAFAEREVAVREAFAPVAAWSPGGGEPLRDALARAVDGYLGFLLERPAFAALLQWEALDGGARLRDVPRESAAIHAAFAAVRQALGARFDPDDAVLVVVSLVFSPLTQRSTFLAALGRDLADPAAREHHVALVTGQLLHLMGAA
ncbi:MAG TPA: TetR family transcriptional regulator [Baekduia sp.]|nr:TetR family transcriptional regulator [Baekduia sp.]